MQTRGGGWLLPDLPLPSVADRDAPSEPRRPGQALACLEAVLDARSAVDRCRWLRLRAEAGRWLAPPSVADGATRD